MLKIMYRLWTPFYSSIHMHCINRMQTCTVHISCVTLQYICIARSEKVNTLPALQMPVFQASPFWTCLCRQYCHIFHHRRCTDDSTEETCKTDVAVGSIVGVYVSRQHSIGVNIASSLGVFVATTLHASIVKILIVATLFVAMLAALDVSVYVLSTALLQVSFLLALFTNAYMHCTQTRHPNSQEKQQTAIADLKKRLNG